MPLFKFAIAKDYWKVTPFPLKTRHYAPVKASVYDKGQTPLRELRHTSNYQNATNKF